MVPSFTQAYAGEWGCSLFIGHHTANRNDPIPRHLGSAVRMCSTHMSSPVHLSTISCFSCFRPRPLILIVGARVVNSHHAQGNREALRPFPHSNCIDRIASIIKGTCGGSTNRVAMFFQQSIPGWCPFVPVWYLGGHLNAQTVNRLSALRKHPLSSMSETGRL